MAYKTKSGIAVSFERVATGHFKVLVNGAESKYVIVNGSLGLSGRGSANIYGIVDNQLVKHSWVGALATAKRMVTQWLDAQAMKKAAEAASAEPAYETHEAECNCDTCGGLIYDSAAAI